MHINSSAVGSSIKAVAGTVPAANSAGTRNGTGIDRTGYHSCVLVAQSGAVTGAPSAQSLAVKLQDSADNVTFADLTGAAITAITAASSSASVNVSLVTARQYIRAVEVTSFTGGTTPTLAGSSLVVLGGPNTLPAA